MSQPLDGQMAFDFAELEREEARSKLGEWSGAPLHFTMDYYPPAMLDEAFEHWCFLNGHMGSHPRSHMWHRSITTGETELGEHIAASFDADVRPSREAEGPGELLRLVVCEPCEWHTIAGHENLAVEAWHDHALPGWRELPVVPAEIRVRNEKGLTKLARAWIAEHYPQHMQVPGAPIITERQRYGTRHVPCFSPWGGYDLSSTALDHPVQDLDHSERPRRRQVTPPIEPKRPDTARYDLPSIGF